MAGDGASTLIDPLWDRRGAREIPTTPPARARLFAQVAALQRELDGLAR